MRKCAFFVAPALMGWASLAFAGAESHSWKGTTSSVSTGLAFRVVIPPSLSFRVQTQNSGSGPMVILDAAAHVRTLVLSSDAQPAEDETGQGRVPADARDVGWSFIAVSPRARQPHAARWSLRHVPASATPMAIQNRVKPAQQATLYTITAP